MTDLRNISGFDWDDGNARKNEKRGVSAAEADPKAIYHDGYPRTLRTNSR